MDQIIDTVGQFIETNQFWAGPVIAALTFGESLLIVGLLIPATALLLLIGGLVGSGTLPLMPVLLWGIAGAILGDAVSYIVGRWLGPSIVRRWPLNRHRSAVARARLFFYKYGFASVLMGRFLGPIRATIPTVAGIMRMNMMSFQVANILSAVLWVPIMLAPGYITARSLGTAENAQQIGLVVGTIASVVIGVGLLVMMVRKRRPARTARRDRPVS